MWRPPTLEPGVLLGLADVVTTYTEVLEFAARLATVLVREASWVIAVNLSGLKGRQLYAENAKRRLSPHYIAQINAYGWEETFPSDRLLANAGEAAVQKARDLFLRFRADLSVDVLRDIQKDTRRVS